MTERGYPVNWSTIAREVKQRAGWRCELVGCRHAHDPLSGYSLTVHHRDGDPSNCAPENLRALCQRCHLQAKARLLKYGPEDETQMRLEI